MNHIKQNIKKPVAHVKEEDITHLNQRGCVQRFACIIMHLI